MSQPEITADITWAAKVLQSGGIIGMPTETVYGLAGLALNEVTVRRIYDTKGRPYDHPLIVHLSPDEDITKWGVFNEDAMALAQTFWPGPLTLLVPRTSTVPDWVTGGRDTVAIRVPSHVVTIELLRQVADGVVAPSANLFGQVSPTSSQHVVDDLGKKVDLVLEGGTCEIGLESTIVECVTKTQVLRPGHISAAQIETVISSLEKTSSVESRAPGMLQNHYSPRAEVWLFEESSDARQAELHNRENGIRTCIIYETSLTEYARTLYAQMRKADDDDAEVIIAVLPPDIGIGSAIRDRLTKAAHQG